MLSFELRQIAGMAAGTYFVVTDNSPQQNIQTFSNLRVAPIVVPDGPTNQLIVFQQGDKAALEKVFNKVNRKQEKLGNYSISSCLKMLENGPLAVINLRNYSDADTVQVSAENLKLEVPEAIKSVPYSDLVYENGFWVVKPTRLTEVYSQPDLLNFVNVGSKSKSYFVVKANPLDVEELTNEGYETLADMEVKVDNFPLLRPETVFNDTFVSVYVFNNNFLDANTNEFYGDLFTNGLIDENKLSILSKNKYSGFIEKVTGTLIPFTKSEFNSDISIDVRMNAVSASTGLHCIINTEIFENESDFDVFAGSRVNHEYLSELTYDNGTQKMVFNGLTTIDSLKSLSYEFKPTLVDNKVLDNNTIAESGSVNLLNYNKDLRLLNDSQLELETKLLMNGLSAMVTSKHEISAFTNYNITGTETEKLTALKNSKLYNKFLVNRDLHIGVGTQTGFNGVEILTKPKYVEIESRTVTHTEATLAVLANNNLATFLPKIFTFVGAPVTVNGAEFTLGAPKAELFLPAKLLSNVINGTTQNIINLQEFESYFKTIANKISYIYKLDVAYNDNTTQTFSKTTNYNETLTISQASERLVFYKNGDANIKATTIKATLSMKGMFTTILPVAEMNITVDPATMNLTMGTPAAITAANVQPVVAATQTIDVVDYKFINVDADKFTPIVDNYRTNLTNPAAVVEHKLVAIDPSIENVLSKTTLAGLQLRNEQLYNGSSVRQNELLDVMISPSIIRGFKNTKNIRYFVDCFKSFVEPAYKYQFNKLVHTLDKCNIFTRAFINEPFVDDLIKSANPSFKDAVGDTRTVKLDKYLGTGGNETTSTKFLTKPTEGAELVYYFGSGDSDGYNIKPVAPIVANAFMDKQKPWSIVANTTGVLSGINGLELDPDEPERRAMERFGWNPIIKKGNQFVIYGDYTGLQAFKKRKALSFISNSELLMYIKQELYNMSLDENFKKGRYEDYIKFETEVTNFMEDLALQGAIRANPVVKCNFENNTTDVQNVGIKLVKVAYYNFRTLDKVVFDLELN